MKNPFVEGDVIWFVDERGPASVWTATDNQTFENTQGHICDLEEVLTQSYLLLYEGPYRVTNTEDWSNYNFEEIGE